MATRPEHYREAEELLDHTNVERAKQEEEEERTEPPRRVLASQWARAEAYQGSYQVRLGAGYGIVRVFVKGPDDEVAALVKENKPDWWSA